MERGCKRQTSIRVSHQNTSVTLAHGDDIVSKENTSVTLAHGDDRVTKENKDCDNTTRVKIEPEVLNIHIGQPVERDNMAPNSYR